MKLITYKLKLILILFIWLSQSYAGNDIDNAILTQLYGVEQNNIAKLKLHKLEENYPDYFRSEELKSSQFDIACKSILELLQKNESKILSITNLSAKEFSQISIILITDKKIYYSVNSIYNSFIIAKSADADFISSININISKIKNLCNESSHIKKDGGASLVVLYAQNSSLNNYILNETTLFPEFCTGEDKIFKEIRQKALAYLGFNVLGQGITTSHYKILAKELNERVSKYKDRNQLLLLRNKHYSHSLNELLYYYATSTEKIAPLMYMWVLNINEILKRNKLLFEPIEISNSEMSELRKDNSLLAKYILYLSYLRIGDNKVAFSYKKNLQNNKIDNRLIHFWSDFLDK